MLGPGIYTPEGLMGTGQTALGMAETEVLWFRGRGCPQHAVDHAPERGLPRCTLAWGLQGLPARSLGDVLRDVTASVVGIRGELT